MIAAPASVVGTPLAGCPAATGNFVLECKGQVGNRPQRTAVVGGQATTYANGEGPGGGEFLNDRRDQGTGANHNESTLGSVVTYPGVDEIASSAMDPYTGINRNGLMWFDQNTGVATRGFDQVSGEADTTSETFQKGGGLGSVALLGVASPVEIGNRVWLDADLNGRQDPGRAGDQRRARSSCGPPTTAGAPECLIGTTSTATINGQPGTYYFRSDTPALQNVALRRDRRPVSFTTNASYVVVFPSGAGDAVDLWTTRARMPTPITGFAGLTWAQLQRTPQAVRIAPTATNGGTTALNDSNPAVGTGRAPVNVGGPGENDHTIDAGWYGRRAVRGGEDRHRHRPAGPDLHRSRCRPPRTSAATTDCRPPAAIPHGRDPQVTKTSYELTPGTPVASGENYPYGYTLTLKETDPVLPDGAVTYNPPDPDDPTQAQVVISPTAGRPGRSPLR